MAISKSPAPVDGDGWMVQVNPAPEPQLPVTALVVITGVPKLAHPGTASSRSAIVRSVRFILVGLYRQQTGNGDNRFANIDIRCGCTGNRKFEYQGAPGDAVVTAGDCCKLPSLRPLPIRCCH